MDQVKDTGRTFAERLREAVNESTTSRSARAGRHRSARDSRSAFSPLANPRRVSYSDELFFELVRKALD